jgi:hypothetical protein
MQADEKDGLYNEPITLSEKDAEVFFNEIQNPAEPNQTLVEAAERYTDEAKKKDNPQPYLQNLKRDFSKRGIDVDGDGTIDGYDTNGDGLIDIMTPGSSSRWRYVEKIKPPYARKGFDWSDTSKWIRNQNAVNYYLTYINPKAESKYPDNFESKTY